MENNNTAFRMQVQKHHWKSMLSHHKSFVLKYLLEVSPFFIIHTEARPTANKKPKNKNSKTAWKKPNKIVHQK